MPRCSTCGGDVGEGAARCPIDGTPVAVPLPATAETVAAGAVDVARGDSLLLGRRLEPGVMVGEYEVSGVLEEGGMGAIYAATHPVIGKRVAIKVLGAFLSQDETMTQRFIQEARAVNEIRNDNIVDIFGFGRLPDGRFYYVMELLTGQSLKARHKQAPPLRYDETLSILTQVCDALAAAHAKGIVHRDLKPDNVFLLEATGAHKVKLLDFGIAKLLRGDNLDQKTAAGLLIGTPQYMSPEQCTSKELDARTDIYSLGVIMFELFTGRLPFLGTSAIEVINGHIGEPPPVPKDLAPMPPDLNDLVLACLAKEPEQRPAAITEVREKLVEISISQALGLEGGLPEAMSEAVAAPPTESPPPAARPTTIPAVPAVPAVTPAPDGRRRRVLRYAGAAIVLGFAAFGVWMAVDRLRARRPAPAPKDVAVLQILSEPPGANVTLDGRRQALLTPYVRQVAWAPRVQLRLELEGYAPHEETITLTQGEREKAVRAVLVRARAVPPPASAPASAEAPARKKPSGVAPRIHHLRLKPEVAVVGAKTAVSGEVRFDDADGDLRAVMAEVKSGTPRRPQRIQLHVAGATTGTASFTFLLAPARTGPHAVEIWVVDEEGHASNRLSAIIEAQGKEGEPPEKGLATPKPDAAPRARPPADAATPARDEPPPVREKPRKARDGGAAAAPEPVAPQPAG